METTLKKNAMNQIPKDCVFYRKNESIDSISLILKGRVLLSSNGGKVLMGSGYFLGIQELYQGQYAMNYMAYEDVVLYSFDVKTIEEFKLILDNKKEYRALAQLSLNKQIITMDQIYFQLKQSTEQVYSFIQKIYKEYQQICEINNQIPSFFQAFEDIQLYVQSEMKIEEKQVQFYKASAKIPIAVQREYFSNGSSDIVLYHLENQAIIVDKLLTENENLAFYLYELFQCIIETEEDNLFIKIANLIVKLEQNQKKYPQLYSALDSTIDQINKIELLLNEQTGFQVVVNRKQMEEIYFSILSGDASLIKQESTNDDLLKEDRMKLVQGSLDYILQYAQVETDIKLRIIENIKKFSMMKDKSSTDDESRKIRKQITDDFYIVYEAVFLRVYKEKEEDIVLNLFLNYGFYDETLLTEEQIIQLCQLKEEKPEQQYCNIFTIKQWLIEIYEGRRQPSKNEFDIDYQDMLREQKKQKVITEEEEKEHLMDPLKKITYEIKNLFRYNSKILNGQVSIFVPMLYKEELGTDIKRNYITSNKIDCAVKKIVSIDYSAFYRESLYINEQGETTRNYIIKEIVPDIILLPINGYKGVMWQDMEQKKRTTSGRFLLPILLDGNLDGIVIKVMGQYRFELCRTMQGVAWNDIKLKSLTSEYSDYVQFYKKNRELSETRKEQLKIQIQKARNSTREVFAQDYEIWIKNESQGALRLNKIAREIMATYCPFSKEVKQRLGNQPVFLEAMQQYNREKIKKSKELDLRIRIMEKEGKEIPKEILETKKYYEDN